MAGALAQDTNPAKPILELFRSGMLLRSISAPSRLLANKSTEQRARGAEGEALKGLHQRAEQAHQVENGPAKGERQKGCRSRGNPGDAVQYLLRNDDPIERGLCINGLGINDLGVDDLGVVRIRQHRLGIAITAPARAAIWLNRAAVRTPIVQ